MPEQEKNILTLEVELSSNNQPKVLSTTDDNSTDVIEKSIHTNSLEKDSKKTTHKVKKTAKPKCTIESIDQLISVAYSRKGQKISLKPKEEKAVCTHFRLSPDTRKSLLDLAKNDPLLAVPRQLMFSVADVVGYTAMQDELYEFVADVMKQHPLFVSEELQEVLKGSSALSVMKSLELLANQKLQDLQTIDQKQALVLKSNAVNCFAVWIVWKKSISVEELSQALYAGVWQPQTSCLKKTSSSQLRIITELNDFAGIAIVCQVFRNKAAVFEKIADTAHDAEEQANQKVIKLSQEVDVMQLENSALSAEIINLKEMLALQNRQHEDAVFHMKDDYERRRTRVLRRLKNDAILLGEGLHALRRDEPKIRIMDDHAERVLESLRVEISQLEMEG